MNISIEIKLINGGVIPFKIHSTDAGYDCTANEVEVVSVSDELNDKGEVTKKGKDYIKYKLGFALSLPENRYVSLVPRSSISDTDMHLSNSPGTGDESYRGEYQARFHINGLPRFVDTIKQMDLAKAYNKDITKSDDILWILENILRVRLYHKGDRVCQLLIHERHTANWIPVNELDATLRGEGGFGSTEISTNEVLSQVN